jgi:uncharacterized protein YaaN involved in tellurite resistance
MNGKGPIERPEEEMSLIPMDGEMLPAEITEPVPPQGATEAEMEELRVRAVELIRRLGQASGSAELELADRVTHLGIQAQRKAGSQLDLLRVRVRDMISQGGPGAEISNDLVDLRLALKQISPHEFGRPGALGRLFGGKPPILRTLEKIAVRYEPVSRQVAIIETKLREGRALLARDNIELRKLYEQVEAQQLVIRKNIYLGELIMQELDRLIQQTADALRVERLRNVLYDVSVRVQDLRTMEAVHGQFFVSIEMTRQNNTRLGQAVERTLNLATNVITVGLAIQAALVRQEKIQEATLRTREFLGNVIVANAETIKRHTQEIGDLYNNPVIATEKLEQAHNELMQAMDTAERIKQQGIDSARANIARLGQLSADLQRRVSGLAETGEVELLSAEA